MSSKLRTEIVSFGHTFAAVFAAALFANIDSLDLTNLNRDVIISFGIAVLRSAIKLGYNKLFPEPIA